MDVTSKTHRYIKIRNFPSDHVLKKFHEGNHKARLSLQETVRIYNDFYKNFVEYITKKPYKHFQTEYLDAIRCSKEEIHEMTGVKIAVSENVEVYCVPRNSDTDRICNWILENVPKELKVKELKKTVGTYMDHGPSTYFRENFKMPDHLKKKLK